MMKHRKRGPKFYLLVSLKICSHRVNEEMKLNSFCFASVKLSLFLLLIAVYSCERIEKEKSFWHFCVAKKKKIIFRNSTQLWHWFVTHSIYVDSRMFNPVISSLLPVFFSSSYQSNKHFVIVCCNENSFSK